MILSISLFSEAQNLVVNPSFEQHSQCPNSESQINYCDSWRNGDSLGTVDYYSALNCSGNFSPPILKPTSFLTFYRKALSGESFAGFIPYYGMGANHLGVEYVQGKFSSTLIANQLYYVEFYINSASKMEYTIHDIAGLINVYSGYIKTNNLQNYYPQILPTSNIIYKDTLRWMRINGFYTALGGENCITIGNFTPYGEELKDSTISYLGSEAYYFLDSVGVYPVTHIDAWDAGPDKHINLGDSVQVGNTCSDYSIFKWVTSTNSTTYLSDSTMPQIWSKPPLTTTYYVTKTQGSIVFQDTVTVYVTNPSNIVKLNNISGVIKIYPNPAKNVIHIDSRNIDEIKLLDVLGNEVIIATDNEIDISNLINGLYFVSVNTRENNYIQKIIIQH